MTMMTTMVLLMMSLILVMMKMVTYHVDDVVGNDDGIVAVVLLFLQGFRQEDVAAVHPEGLHADVHDLLRHVHPAIPLQLVGTALRPTRGDHLAGIPTYYLDKSNQATHHTAFPETFLPVVENMHLSFFFLFILLLSSHFPFLLPLP